MPSDFLKSRLPAFQEEVAGGETVSFFVYDETAKDGFTGTVAEASAYPAAGVALPALVNYHPSEASRKSFGADIDFDALLMIAIAHLEAKSITLKVGDAFTLPGHGTDKFYVKKIASSHQVDDQFLERRVAVSHKHGRR
jgi:hypothetical protein